MSPKKRPPKRRRPEASPDVSQQHENHFPEITVKLGVVVTGGFPLPRKDPYPMSTLPTTRFQRGSLMLSYTATKWALPLGRSALLFTRRRPPASSRRSGNDRRGHLHTSRGTSNTVHSATTLRRASRRPLQCSFGWGWRCKHHAPRASDPPPTLPIVRATMRSDVRAERRLNCNVRESSRRKA